MIMRYIFTPLIFFLVCFVPYVEAEASLIAGSQSLSIELSPLYPGPEQAFTATINDYALPVSSAGVRWFIDGKLQETSLNERKISSTTKSVGQKTTLEAVISLSNGGSLSVKRVIDPVYLDIIIEPQTRTPAFYKGRPLPSIESLVNATAIVNGNAISPNDLLYIWRLNDEVIGGGTLRGKNTVTFPMPRGRFATLGLEVQKIGGGVLASRIISLTSVSPDLSFYFTSPLYGLTTRALTGTVPIVSPSFSIRAEPYYLDLRTFNEPDLTEWKLNGRRTFGDQSNPYEITLAKNENLVLGGNTTMDFHVRNTTQVLQGAQSSFVISY